MAVSLPKESAVAIEAIFSQTTRTKWLYNHEERATRYVPVSDRNSEEVPPIDKLQRRLLEESVNCRATEIGNLIRAIEGCLESERYRGIKQHLDAEVSRITDIAARTEQQLLGLQASHQKRIKKAVYGRSLPLAKATRLIARRGPAGVATHQELLQDYNTRIAAY